MVDYSVLLSLLKNAGASDPEQALILLQKFQEFLLEANKSINLVSRKDSDKIVSELCYDSLAMLAHIRYPAKARVLDIGSGAGFPGIVHKLARPDIHLVSVDSTKKKTDFQSAAAEMLGLEQFEVRWSRVEDLAALGVDFVIAKAVGTVELLCKLAKPHLKPGGMLILPRSATPEQFLIEKPFVLEESISYQSSLDGKSSILLRIQLQ